MNKFLKLAAARALGKAKGHAERVEQLASGTRLGNLLEAHMHGNRRSSALDKASRSTWNPLRKKRIERLQKILEKRNDYVESALVGERQERLKHLSTPRKASVDPEPTPILEIKPKTKKKRKSVMKPAAAGLAAAGLLGGGGYAYHQRQKSAGPLEKIAIAVQLGRARDKAERVAELVAGKRIPLLQQAYQRTGSRLQRVKGMASGDDAFNVRKARVEARLEARQERLRTQRRVETAEHVKRAPGSTYAPKPKQPIVRAPRDASGPKPDGSPDIFEDILGRNRDRATPLKAPAPVAPIDVSAKRTAPAGKLPSNAIEKAPMSNKQKALIAGGATGAAALGTGAAIKYRSDRKKAAAATDLGVSQGIGRLGQLLTGSRGRALGEAATHATERAGKVGRPGFVKGFFTPTGRRQRGVNKALTGRADALQQAAAQEQRAVRNTRAGVGGAAALTGGTYLAANRGASRGVDTALNDPMQPKLAAALKLALAREGNKETRTKKPVEWDKSMPMRKGRATATVSGLVPGAAVGGAAAGLANLAGKELKGKHYAAALLGGALAGGLHRRAAFNAGEAKKDIGAVRALAKERESRRIKHNEKFAALDAALTDDMLFELYGV